MTLCKLLIEICEFSLIKEMFQEFSAINLDSWCWWRRSSFASLHPCWKAFVYIEDAFCFSELRLGSNATRLVNSWSNATYLYCRSVVSMGGNSNLTSDGSFVYIFFVSHIGVIAFLLIRSTSFGSSCLNITERNSTG